MTNEEFLLNTLDYYSSDLNRRCTSSTEPYTSSGCKYSPVNANKEGVSDGCAIGRWIKTEELKQEWDRLGVSTYYLLKERKQDLKEEVHNVYVDLMVHAQGLHDYSGNWKEGGLTEEGKITLENTITRFKLDEKLFDKYLND